MDSGFRSWECRPPSIMIYHTLRDVGSTKYRRESAPCQARFCYLRHTARWAFFVVIVFQKRTSIGINIGINSRDAEGGVPYKINSQFIHLYSFIYLWVYPSAFILCMRARMVSLQSPYGTWHVPTCL